jgi:hypothetical protein
MVQGTNARPSDVVVAAVAEDTRADRAVVKPGPGNLRADSLPVAVAADSGIAQAADVRAEDANRSRRVGAADATASATPASYAAQIAPCGL